jgi:hypothetical protein
MTDPDKTADLVDQIARGYREHAAEDAEITAVPGRVLGSDIEDQADALADGARRLTDLLTAFAQEPAPRSMDAIAVFHGLSQAAESMAAAAASCAARSGSTLRTAPKQRPSRRGMTRSRAFGTPRAPSTGLPLAGSDQP